MNISNQKKLIGLFASLIFSVIVSPTATAGLIGINWSGGLYSISEVDASATLIGNTGLSTPLGLETDSSNTVYTYSVTTGGLYTLDTTTANASLIGNSGVSIVEGDLAFSPGGVLYASTKPVSGNSSLVTIDTSSGATTDIGSFGDNSDISGLAWRSDNALIGYTTGVNTGSAGLYEIDPLTGAPISQIVDFGTAYDALGALTSVDDTAYWVNVIGGLSYLYSIDLFTGTYTTIGKIGIAGGGDILNMSGLTIYNASVPEPGTLLLLAAGLLGLGMTQNKRFLHIMQSTRSNLSA